ncbi:MAG: signal peptidase II [Spirochaetota bacterium]|nr:MAG: signal peptidase II [Spirochaetota bacterium]
MFKKRFYIFAIISVCIIAADRVVKWIVRTNLDLNHSIDVLGDLLKISYILNSGIAFGLFDPNPSPLKTPLLLIIQFIALGVILYIFFTIPRDVKLAPVSMGLIFGGAIGNIIDRILRGEVVDFIDLDFPDISILFLNIRMSRWPTFNIADASVFVGIVMLLIIIIKIGGIAESTESA